jgi:3-oxoacid CoA-transferase subunit A
VETGAIEPDQVHLPGIYVHRIVLNATPEKRIEKRTITEAPRDRAVQNEAPRDRAAQTEKAGV